MRRIEDLCDIEGCDAPHRSKGLCEKHYMRKRRAEGKSLTKTKTPTERAQGRICAIEGCDRPWHAREWCKSHYERWRRHAHPLEGRERTPSDELRDFVQAVLAGTAKRERNGCILWPYGVRPSGYPYQLQLGRKGRQVTPQEAVLEQVAGLKPSPDHTVGHAPHSVCGHRHCIAPEHLSWQTWTEQREQIEADRAMAGV